MLCELCGSAGPFSPRFPLQGIVECAACGLVFYDGRVDTAALYTKHYFLGDEYRDYIADWRSWALNFRNRCKWLKSFIPKNGALLEIGCAYGAFLNVAREYWRVRGLDLAADAVDYATNTLRLNVTRADFLDLPDEPETLDAICLWDTIEHLSHPVRTLEKTARWLKPGGIIVLSTGDIESVVARFQGERWRQIHPPTHLFYFSRKTLEAAFKKAGLRLKDFSYRGQFRESRSMLHGLLSGKKYAKWIYYGLTMGGGVSAPVYLNLYDILFAIAEKPGASRP